MISWAKEYYSENIAFFIGLHCLLLFLTMGFKIHCFHWSLLQVTPKPNFIAHGGGNGIHETIYRGIPTVKTLVFIDHPEDIAYMEAKGPAIRLDLNTMSSSDFPNALKPNEYNIFPR